MLQIYIVIMLVSLFLLNLTTCVIPTGGDTGKSLYYTLSTYVIVVVIGKPIGMATKKKLLIGVFPIRQVSVDVY